MRILLISTMVFPVPPRGYGGVEGVLEDLAIELLNLGHEVSIVCPKGSVVPGAELIMPCEPNFNNPEQVAYEAYKERLESGEWDVIHDHSWAGFPYLSKYHKADLPICHTIHAQQPWGCAPPVVAPCLIAASKWQAEHISATLGVHAEVCYHGINLDSYKYSPEKEGYLLYVGRITPFKGTHEFVSLCKKMRMQGKIVGEDIYIDAQHHPYVRRVMDSCDGKNIVYIGRVARGSDLMIELMQKAKAVVTPLLPNYFEIFGLATIEAMACGTPVISTDRGAAKELIVDGETGFVVPTINELEEAVSRLDECSPEACRQRAEGFSRENMACRHEELYDNIIKGKPW